MNNEKDPITEYLKIVIKIMFTQNIIVIAIALGLAIISAFITIKSQLGSIINGSEKLWKTKKKILLINI